MAEIHPIQGPIRPDNAGKKDKDPVNPQKFKEEEKKVQKIRETDPDTKKKRKRQEEEETPSPEQDTPLSLTSSKSLEASPFEVQSPSSKTSSASKGHETAQVPLKESYTPTAPPEPNLGEEGGFGDEEAFLQNLPSTPQGYKSSAPPAPPAKQTPEPSYPPPDITSQPPQTTNPSYSTPSYSTPPDLPSQTSSSTPISSNDQKTSETPPQKNTKAAPGPESPAATKSTKKTGPLPPSVKPLNEKEEVSQKETLLHPLAAHPPAKAAPPKEKTQESADNVSLEGAIPGPAPSQGAQQDKGDSDKKDKEPSTGLNMPSSDPAQIGMAAPSVTGEPLPVYTSFHPAVLEIFDRMVGTLEILQFSSGERKTTITLTSPQFASSAFYGAEIIIEEDTSVAPGQYNIKLLGSPEAVNLFQAHMNDLVAAFQSGKYNFRVHRLEAGIQTTEKHLFKRKEKASGGESGSDQGRNQ